MVGPRGSVARIVSRGGVWGVDRAHGELGKAAEQARRAGVANVFLQCGDAGRLPFAEGVFDLVFFHGVLCHQSDPAVALREALRVTRSGGCIAAREPDEDGNLWYPRENPGATILDFYYRLRRENGGDTRLGSKLAALFHAVGLADVHASASYESFSGSKELRAHFGSAMTMAAIPGFADRIEQLGWADRPAMQRVVEESRSWLANPASFFSRAWGEAVGRKP